jgi:hypothetical protein
MVMVPTLELAAASCALATALTLALVVLRGRELTGPRSPVARRT